MSLVWLFRVHGLFKRPTGLKQKEEMWQMQFGKIIKTSFQEKQEWGERRMALCWGLFKRLHKYRQKGKVMTYRDCENGDYKSADQPK